MLMYLKRDVVSKIQELPNDEVCQCFTKEDFMVHFYGWGATDSRQFTFYH